MSLFKVKVVPSIPINIVSSLSHKYFVFQTLPNYVSYNTDDRNVPLEPRNYFYSFIKILWKGSKLNQSAVETKLEWSNTNLSKILVKHEVQIVLRNFHSFPDVSFLKF